MFKVPLFKIPFIRKEKKDSSEEKEVEIVRSVPIVEGAEIVLGILSGKGGCGKSTIATNLAVLLSALLEKNTGVMVVDMDIVNATTTSMLLSVIFGDLLREDDGISTLNYIVEEPNTIRAYKLTFSSKYTLSIQVSKKKDLGVAVKNIYIIPAKKATISYEVLLSRLVKLSREEVRNSLHALYNNVLLFSRKNNIKYLIFDFPPLRADTRNVYDGVFSILDMISNFILVSSFDYSAVHGLVSIMSRTYSYIKGRTLAFVINMADPSNEEMTKKIRTYIENVYGSGMVYFIRDDPRWKVGVVPPIVLGDPSEGAHYDLISMCVKTGLVNPDVVKKKLNVDVVG